MHHSNGLFRFKIHKDKSRDGFNNCKNMNLKLNINLAIVMKTLILCLDVLVYTQDWKYYCSKLEDKLPSYKMLDELLTDHHVNQTVLA